MIYFDNAATTFPKPPSVINECVNCMTNYCGNPGRSGHRLSIEAAKKIYDCREIIAQTFGSAYPTNVVFTQNATYALNIAINAFIKKRCHVLISDIEHNSVFRTVCHFAEQGCEYDVFSIDPYDTQKTLKSLKSKIKYNTSLIVCNHASNVCGIHAPIFEIGQICRIYGIKFVVDASQSAGYRHIDIKENNIDALCSAGHKGLYGPQGTGFVLFSDLYSSKNEIAKLNTFAYGGNGYNSSEKTMPDILPERFECGTLNTPAIAGLYEGLRFVNMLKADKIRMHTSMLYNKAVDMISSLPGTKVYYGDIKDSSVLLFNIGGIDNGTVADMLDEQGICVRSGLHCSPLAHKKLNTNNGGVRLSFSCFNNVSELETFYKVLKDICLNK